MPVVVNCLYGAARHGHLHVLQWAHENGCSWGILTAEAAYAGGHRNVIEYLWQNNCPGLKDYERGHGLNQ